MPLAIILDKSSFQMLNPDEINLLHNYYLPNITPILVMEVLGDLKREVAEGVVAADRVIQFAKKLLPRNSAVNIYYPKLVEMELRGDRYSMDYRPLVGEIVPKETATGQKGFLIRDSSEEIALNRWRNGEFTDLDELTSQLWRDTTTQKDVLENLKAALKKADSTDAKLKNLTQLQDHVASILNTPESQQDLLQFVITEFGIPVETAKIAMETWDREASPTLEVFAPFAYHCCKVKLLFYLGLKNDLFGTRPTNHVDLQYLYYLPFTRIISSNDKFHKSFIPLVLSDNQTFITGDELKKDLSNLVSYRATLDAKKDIERTLREPPQIDSLTVDLWKKYLAWPSKLDRALSQKEFEEAKKKIDEFIEAKASTGATGVMDDPEFIVKEYWMSPEDPCPCGSGKRLKECHMPKS